MGSSLSGSSTREKDMLIKTNVKEPTHTDSIYIVALDSEGNNELAIKCRWFKAFNGMQHPINNPLNTIYNVTPDDIGYSLKVYVNLVSSETSTVQFFPKVSTNKDQIEAVNELVVKNHAEFEIRVRNNQTQAKPSILCRDKLTLRRGEIMLFVNDKAVIGSNLTKLHIEKNQFHYEIHPSKDCDALKFSFKQRDKPVSLDIFFESRDCRDQFILAFRYMRYLTALTTNEIFSNLSAIFARKWQANFWYKHELHEQSAIEAERQELYLFENAMNQIITVNRGLKHQMKECGKALDLLEVSINRIIEGFKEIYLHGEEIDRRRLKSMENAIKLDFMASYGSLKKMTDNPRVYSLILRKVGLQASDRIWRQLVDVHEIEAQEKDLTGKMETLLVDRSEPMHVQMEPTDDNSVTTQFKMYPIVNLEPSIHLINQVSSEEDVRDRFLAAHYRLSSSAVSMYRDSFALKKQIRLSQETVNQVVEIKRVVRDRKWFKKASEEQEEGFPEFCKELEEDLQTNLKEVIEQNGRLREEAKGVDFVTNFEVFLSLKQFIFDRKSTLQLEQSSKDLLQLYSETTPKPRPKEAGKSKEDLKKELESLKKYGLKMAQEIAIKEVEQSKLTKKWVEMAPEGLVAKKKFATLRVLTEERDRLMAEIEQKVK